MAVGGHQSNSREDIHGIFFFIIKSVVLQEYV